MLGNMSSAFFLVQRTLSLNAHVSLLCFFRLWEIACDICDVDQGPRIGIALLSCFEPSLFH